MAVFVEGALFDHYPACRAENVSTPNITSSSQVLSTVARFPSTINPPSDYKSAVIQG